MSLSHDHHCVIFILFIFREILNWGTFYLWKTTQNLLTPFISSARTLSFILSFCLFYFMTFHCVAKNYLQTQQSSATFLSAECKAACLPQPFPQEGKQPSSGLTFTCPVPVREKEGVAPAWFLWKLLESSWFEYCLSLKIWGFYTDELDSS